MQDRNISSTDNSRLWTEVGKKREEKKREEGHLEAPGTRDDPCRPRPGEGSSSRPPCQKEPTLPSSEQWRLRERLRRSQVPGVTQGLATRSSSADPDATPFPLTPRDADAARFLKEVAVRGPKGIVLKKVEEAPRRAKGVLLGFSLDYYVVYFKRKLGDEVTHVRRCTIVRESKRVPTRSVELIIDRESLPETLSLGWLGRYHVRPFAEEPMRCYKCQKYRHVSRLCRGPMVVCAVCAMDHDTKSCFASRREEASRPPPR